MILNKDVSIKSFFLLILFFLFISISTNWMTSQLSVSIKILISILLIVIFYETSSILFYFLIYCYFFRYSLNGSLIGIELDQYISGTNYLGMVNTSDMIFLALMGTTIIQGKYRSVILDFNNPIILCLILFCITQVIATVFSTNIFVSYERVIRLMKFIIFFIIIMIYAEEISLSNILKFMSALGIVSGIIYIYNILLIGNDEYQDDGNIIYLMPFVFNTFLITKKKSNGLFIFFHGILTFISMALMDIRRFVISNFIFINNVFYRVVKRKQIYFISITTFIIFFFSISELLEDRSELRIFNTFSIIKGMATFGLGDTEQEDFYNIFTRRDVMFGIGVQAFLESPIIGIGAGVSEFETGKLFFGDYIQKAYRLHNLYLQLLADSGIIGFFAYISVLFVIIRALVKITKVHTLNSKDKVMTRVLLDIFLMTSVINLLGSRGPYDKYEWYFYTLVYILSIKYLKSGKIVKSSF